MKVTFISNAAAVYESQGYRLLADPWLTPTAFEGSWHHSPPLKATPHDYVGVDALYISHIHPDHLDAETLKHFRRDIPIVTLEDQHAFCRKHLVKMGFTKVFGLPDTHRLDRYFGPFTLTMFGPFATHPFHAGDCELGNVVDSSLLLSDGRHSVLNANDNTPTALAAQRLRETYGPVDLAQLNYNAAGPYPCCFLNLSLDEKRAESERLITRNLEHMADVAIALGAKAVQPFAGAFRLGGSPEKEAMNDYNGTCSPERAALYLESRGLKSLVLAEGEGVELGE